MYTVGEVVRAARRRRGWGQRRLAEVSGVPQPNVAAIESGQRVPSLAMVRRLVDACGLQVRFDLELRHAEVDARIEAAWRRWPLLRAGRAGFAILTTASGLVHAGARLVLDGPLAAVLLGAPVGEPAERMWCDPADAERLRVAAARRHHDFRLLLRRPGEDGQIREGGQARVGDCLITFGRSPPARWQVESFGVPLPVTGVETLQAYAEWTGPERVAVRRLAAMLSDHGERSHGLDPLDGPAGGGARSGPQHSSASGDRGPGPGAVESAVAGVDESAVDESAVDEAVVAGVEAAGNG